MVFVTVDWDSYIREGMLERYSGSALGHGWIYDRIVLCLCWMFLMCCNGEGLDGRIQLFRLCLKAPTIEDKWTNKPHWVMSCQKCTWNYFSCIGVLTILRKLWELSHWTFGVTVCQLREPRTLWHNAWSCYRGKNLLRKFPILNHN